MSQPASASYTRRRQKAMHFYHARKYARAAPLLAQLLREHPGDIEVACLLGKACNRSGQQAEASKHLQAALAHSPGHPDLLVELGTALTGLDDSAGAADAFNKALAARPEHAGAWLGLARSHMQAGRRRDALSACERAAALDRNDPQPLILAGRICLQEENTSRAAYQLNSALLIEPRNSEAHTLLGQCHYRDARFGTAIRHFRSALEQDPRGVDTCVGLGEALLATGSLQEAEKLFERALKQQRDNATALVGKAQALVLQHRPDAARTTLQPLLERTPPDAAAAVLYAGICRQPGECRHAIELMQEVMASAAPLALRDRRALHFNLGKLYDGIRDYDAAFTHIRQANELQPCTYDAAGFESLLRHLTGTCTRATLAALPKATGRHERPVFIVGMPRSGTTLVEQILGAHSTVHAAGELDYLPKLIEALAAETGSAYPDCIKQLTPELADRCSRRYLERLARLDSSSLRVTDKMPHNFIHLGLIQLLFPGSRVIHCTRDARDTCLSIYFQSFNASHSYASDLTALGTHYRQYQRLMDHWKLALDLPILEVRYEEVVRDIEGQTRRLLEFCGLDWEDNCLRFHEQRRFTGTASEQQVNRPLYASSVGRWQHYRAQLGELLQLLGSDDRA